MTVDSLDELLAGVLLEAVEVSDKLADKTDDDPDSFIQEARNLNPGAISRRSLRALNDVEVFIRTNIGEILSSHDETHDWQRTAQPLLKAGWIRQDVEHDLMDVERTLRDLRSAALSYGRFWSDNAGVGGIVKGAVSGYLNPLDGWLSFVGKNSRQTEQDYLISELADAFSDLRNAVETLREHIVTLLQIKFSEIYSAAEDL